MDDQKRLLIERECDRLVTRYCHRVDHGEAERVAELFSDDGIWTGPGVRMEGIEEIRKGFAMRQANAGRMSRHVCQNLLVDVLDEDHAEGVVYVTLYRHDGDPDRKASPLEGPAMVGEYRDRFVRTDAGWRFVERDTRVSFFREDDS
jgi:uncharacterized protein (TIGR02246 family)